MPNSIPSGTPPAEAEFGEPPERPSKTKFWWPVLIACAFAGAIYLTLDTGKEPEQETESSSPGWEDLLDCSRAALLDGTKELSLSENHRAVLYDKTKKENGRYLTVNGSWNFDETSKLYTVTLNGEATAYSIVEPEGATLCMLIKGDPGAADLRASWFSSIVDKDRPGDKRERD
jgi:hypothetical protein